MASSANDDDRPGPTPVPPRGGKRKPNRPTGKVAPTGRPTPNGRPAVSGRPAAKGRPADNRRAAMVKRRQRNQTLTVLGVIVVIVAVIGIFVGIKVSGGNKSNTASTAVLPSTLDSYTGGVSLKALQAAGNNYDLTAVSGQGASAYPQVAADKPITTAGKPEILYVGAEYCPYCATERWPLVLALSKFGTFHNLSSIHSAGVPEKYPNTATFSFYKSTYTSPYVTFTPVEEETVDEKTLQKPTAAQEAIVNKYDTSGDIPFVYFNGKAIISGAEYNPALLAGKTFQQIADDISAGQSTLASSVIADAGAIVSTICHMTGGQPGNVCSLFPKPITS